ncbi:MAG: SDR family oxidoreductase [Lutibacter sp.]
MKLTNKIFWITGASSGIGRALTIELSKRKVKLIISGRNKDALNKTVDFCENKNLIKTLPFDLEDFSEMKKITEKAVSFFGKIDVLINNGGISQRSLAVDTNLSVDEKIMNVNYLGTVALTKAILPYFIKQQSGYFVVITSIVGKIGTPLRSTYSASKHALHGFFDSLRAEVYPYHIKVMLVCPGFVQTQVSINALTGNGNPQNKMDEATKNGIKPAIFAQKLISAIKSEKQEVYIAGFKEKLGVYLKRFFPKLLSTVIRKTNVT